MRFDMARVDHECRQFGCVVRQRFKDTFENACLGPTFPAVVKRLGRAIFGWHIGPAIASLNTENDAQKNLAISHSRYTTRLVWKQETDFVKLFFSEPENSKT